MKREELTPRRQKVGWALVIGLLAMAMFAGAARAVPIVADPDSFAVGTDISNAFPGVTLSAVGRGWNNSTGRIIAVDPLTNQSEPFAASTGKLVFGTDDGSYPHLFREAGFMQLRADFADPTNNVSLDFIGNDASDTGLLEAYDESGNLLGTVLSSALGIDEVGSVSFEIPTNDIAFILAGGAGIPSSLGIDNLRTSHSPEPATLALLGTGLAGLLVLRRRRRS